MLSWCLGHLPRYIIRLRSPILIIILIILWSCKWFRTGLRTRIVRTCIWSLYLHLGIGHLELWGYLLWITDRWCPTRTIEH